MREIRRRGAPCRLPPEAIAMRMDDARHRCTYRGVHDLSDSLVMPSGRVVLDLAMVVGSPLAGMRRNVRALAHTLDEVLHAAALIMHQLATFERRSLFRDPGRGGPSHRAADRGRHTKVAVLRRNAGCARPRPIVLDARTT